MNILIALAALAQSAPKRGIAEDGAEVKKDVAALTQSIHWQTALDAAKAEAKREGKLIFWMHMLGRLEGST